MGVPHHDHQQESEEDTLPGSARRGDVAADSDHDDTAPALGAAANGDQSELGQSARGTHSQSGLSAAAAEEPEPKRVPAEEPEPKRVPAEEPEPKRVPAEEPEPKRRVPEEAAATARPKQPATGEEGSGRFPAEQSSRGSVSVTVLTLDAATELRPRSRQQVLFTPRAGDTLRLGDREAGGDMSDLKLIRDFQVRRKYGRRPGHVPPASMREKNFINLGLSGTRYFGGGGGGGGGGGSRGTASSHHHSSNIASSSIAGSIGTATLSLDSSRSRKTLALPEDVAGRVQNGPVPVSPALARVQQEEDRAGSVDSVLKDLQSPAPSFPPLSPAGGPGKGGVKSENSFYSARHNGQSPSLLVNHFGFSTIRPDTFSGIQRQRRLKVTSTNNDDLIRELEQHAQKQILACQNMGYTHRGSRAAASVLSLKHTVSPSAFHPSSFFTKHVSREDREQREGTPRGERGEDTRKRRVTHPTPAGKLSVPRLLVQDRQDQAAARRAALPTVSGNSLQVMLAQSHAK